MSSQRLVWSCERVLVDTLCSNTFLPCLRTMSHPSKLMVLRSSLLFGILPVIPLQWSMHAVIDALNLYYTSMTASDRSRAATCSSVACLLTSYQVKKTTPIFDLFLTRIPMFSSHVIPWIIETHLRTLDQRYTIELTDMLYVAPVCPLCFFVSRW